jgi:hypothetical protein
MKLNKFLMVLAATAIVGCTSDDLNDFSAKQAPEDSRMIQLDPNFVIAGVGEGDAITRTHWENVGGTLKNKFLPIWDNAPAGGNFINDDADLEAQAVGLCWLGQTSGAPGADVYTNYQFYHFGWLNIGVDEAKFECDELTNGALYDEITVNAGDAAGDEADPTNFVLPAKSAGGLDYNTGIFRTDNKAIFGGDYIVYYPFNIDFDEVGTIPAKAITNFPAATANLTDTYLGDATFRYSKKVHIDGGSQASKFGLKNLSALVNLRVTGNSGGNIDKIVLWSKKEQLLKQANLAADKILAGKTGQELYDTKVGTKTIVATLAAPATSTLPSPAGDVKTYITVLPTTVEDLVAYVHRADGKWAKKDIGSKEFKENSGEAVVINVASSDFKQQYYAVDYTSFTTALAEASGKTTTIELIGDITIPSGTYLTINEPNITIKGDKIIVPEDASLQVKAKVESDIDILGKSCCSGTMGGRLFIDGGTISNVTMEEAEATTTSATYDLYNPFVEYTNGGAVTVAAGKTFDAKAGNIQVNGNVSHKANINIAEGVTLVVGDLALGYDGDLNFMGAKVVNDGTIEVNKDSKFDITDVNGDASATDGKNMTNNGLFIHNVDAAVGTAVQLMNQNGVYRCRVDDQIKLDDAYQKWLACSVIEMVNAGQNYNLGVAEKNINYKHNDKFIDIEVNTTSVTTFTNPANSLGNGDDKNIQVGKLTVMQGGLYIPYVTGTGKRELTVNGDFTASVNVSLWTSKKITVKENLIVNNGAILKYAGKKQNEGGLAVEKDINVSAATFDANSISKVDALDITCANFTLADAATAIFGNRTEGDTKNMTVSGTITNPAGCTFNILGANQVGGSILATITCKKLKVGGNWGDGGKPQVVE